GSFEEYMLSQVRLILMQKNKEAWSRKRLQSIFSLDVPIIPNGDFPPLIDFVKSTPYDDTRFDVKNFLEQLSPIESHVILLLLEERDLKKTHNMNVIRRIEKNYQKQYQSKKQIMY